MRKKLKDKDAELADCRMEMERRSNELITKERVIAERDAVVSDLQQQVSLLNARLKSSVDILASAVAPSPDTEVYASF